MIASEKNIATNVPIIKNGANGTSLLKPFFFKKIRTTPIIAPKKKDKNRPTKILGKPKSKPNNIANLTSPNPIHRPPDIMKIKKKNALAIHDAIR